MAKVKIKPQKIKFDLPSNVKIEERPEGLDLLLRTKNKWLGVIQNLETLESTKVITIDLGDLLDTPGVPYKQKLNSIKASIKNTARSVGFDYNIKFAVKGNKLMLWSDK